MSENSRDYQLRACVTTIDQLKDIDRRIRQTAQDYQDNINALQQQGCDIEVIKGLRTMQRQYTAAADELIKHLKSEHLSYLDDQAKALYNSILETLKAHAAKKSHANK